MAIVFTNLGLSANPDINNSADLSSYASTSWTPPTSGLLIVFVHNRGSAVPAAQPILSGNGLTFVQIASVIRTNDQITLFGANLSGSVAGITTVDFGGVVQLNCTVSFLYATGVDLSGGVAAAFVQSPTAGTGVTTSGSVTLAAASNPQNRAVAMFWHEGNEASTERTNWTKADDMHGSGTVRSLMTEYRSDVFETTASASWTTSSAWRGIAAEIKALVTAYTLSASPGIFAADGQDVTLTYTPYVTITVAQTTLLVSKYHTCVTHVSITDLAYGDATARTRAETAIAPALEFHRLSAHSYGANDPWLWNGTGPRPAEPTNWKNLDDLFAMVELMGGTPILGFGNLPWHTKGIWDGTTTTPMTFAQQLDATGRPITEKLPDVLHFVQRVCERYMVPPHNVRYWQLGPWEMHGFYRGRDGSLSGLWGYDDYAGTPGQADMGMAYLHNQIYAQIVATAASLSTPIPRNQLKIITNYFPCMANGGTSGAYSVGHPLRGRPWGSAIKARPDSLLAHLPLLTPGSWDYWSYDISSHHVDDVITTDDWTNAQLFTEIGEYLNTQVAAIGYGSKPFIISEEYAKPQLDPGSNQFVLRAAMHADAFMRFVKLGASMAMIWSTVGRANNPGADEEAGLHSAAGTSSGGQPQRALDIVQMLHDNFTEGTVIRSTTASNSNLVSVMANPTKAMVVNHLSSPLKVKINSGTPFTMTASETRLVTFAQSYTLTTTGGLTVTGQSSVKLRYGRKMVTQGGLSLNGQSINLRAGHRIVSPANSFVLAGQVIARLWKRLITAGLTTYAVSAPTVFLIHEPPYTIELNPLVYALGNISVTLKRTYVLTVSPGAFALSGQTSLQRSSLLNAVVSTYTLTGEPGQQLFGRRIEVLAVATLTGEDVDIRHALRLAAAAGSFSPNGQSVGLYRQYPLSVHERVFALSGAVVNLLRAHPLTADNGSFTLTGSAVNIVQVHLGHYILLGDPASISITSSALVLAKRKLTSTAGMVDVTPLAVLVLLTRLMTLAPGSFLVVRRNLDLVYSGARINTPRSRRAGVGRERRVIDVKREDRERGGSKEVD
jgi:hypothetical protein